MEKEYELLTVGDITYTNKNIVYKNGFIKYTIPYEDIELFYISTRPGLTCDIRKCITIFTKERKYNLTIACGSFIYFGSFENNHIAFIKKMAPQAKYIKKVPLKKKIKRKLKQIDAFLKSDD